MAGIGDTVVSEAVAFIPGNEVFLAGEDNAAFAACAHGGEIVLQQFPGDALPAIFRQDDKAENSSISAIGLVQGSIVVEGIGQVGRIGGTAIDKADRLAAAFGDEKLLGKNPQAGGNRAQTRRFSRRETGSFNDGKDRGFISMGGADVERHGFSE